MSKFSKINQPLSIKIKREVSPYIDWLFFRPKLLSSPFSKSEGKSKYSAIILIRNSERYIGELIQSLENQSLNFSKNIQLIFVDLASSDDSSQKIKHWMEKYPENITYLYQDSQNVSVARNLALKEVKTPWVTFINGSDFVSSNYFSSVDTLLTENSKLVASYPVFYQEKHKKFKRFSDTHPLRKVFKNGVQRVNAFEVQDAFVQRVESVFFKTELLKEGSLEFQEEVDAPFCDLIFLNSYLQIRPQEKILLNPRGTYYFRAIKNQGIDPILRIDDFAQTHLNILESYSARGKIPLAIQKMIFLNLMDYFIDPEKLNSLSKSQSVELESILQRIFTYLDLEAIGEIRKDELEPFYFEGILARYKNVKAKVIILNIENYDFSDDSVQLSYFSFFDNEIEFFVNGEERLPLYFKKASIDFNHSVIYKKNLIWLSLKEDEELEIKVRGNHSQVNFDHMSGQSVRNRFKKLALKKTGSLYTNSWLFMDRENQADDNAEHLYRYIMKQHPEIPIFFALKKNSHDWQRLYDEGFKLIDLDSKEYKRAFRDCSKVISSHADQYVVKPLGERSLNGKKYIFLQHGVIKHDLSKWLNKKQIDCFVTSTYQEYQSIISDTSPYIYGHKEVLLSGLPRHDRLKELSEKYESEKVILIMPTWRKYLGSEENFINSDFLKSWMTLLQNNALKSLSETYGYKVIFLPHMGLQTYLNEFNVPSYVETLRHSSESIQHLLARGSLMITDYSSLDFEMGVQKKEVIYFQFDQDLIFSGAHHCKRGYFDYHKDGFGPVCVTLNEVIKELEALISAGGNMAPQYLQRVSRTFTHFDGKCCERVVNHILKMDTSPG